MKLEGSKIGKIKFWKFQLQYEETEKIYFGNWKFGERIVGSFTIVKKIQGEL